MTDSRSWMERVTDGLLPEIRRPEIGDPAPTELFNLIRKAQGLPPQTYAEYISEGQAHYDASTPADRIAAAESLAALIDRARAQADLEEAFLRGTPSSEWI